MSDQGPGEGGRGGPPNNFNPATALHFYNILVGGDLTAVNFV